MEFFPPLFKSITVANADIGRIHQSGKYKLIRKTSNAFSFSTFGKLASTVITAFDIKKVIIAAPKYEMIRVSMNIFTILAGLIDGDISMKLGLIFDKTIITKKVKA